MITDELLGQLRSMPKRVVNPRARDSAKERHRGRDFQVTGDGEEFSLFVRQSTLEATSFSCGLLWHAPDGSKSEVCT